MTRNNHVVLGADSEDLADNVASMEFALREARQRGVPIEVVHGCGPRHQVISSDPWVTSQRYEHGRGIVARVAQQLRRMGRFEVHVDVSHPDTSGVDALVAASESAALVVLQARPRGHHLQVAGPGSTVRAVAARAACPVVVLHRHRANEHHGIVVGVEEHGRAQVALRAAAELAARDNVALTAVHAWDVPLGDPAMSGAVPPTPGELAHARAAAQRLMSEALAGLAEDFPTGELRTRVVRGPVVEVRRRVAADADLLVIGRHADSRLAFYALGHAARALLHDAPCPLMVTPPSGPFRATRSLLSAEIPIGTGY
jgi:nucleotide-binding universal stress UspA family protein